MKRDKEVYKLGRMIMNSLRVPLVRKGYGTKYDDAFNIKDSNGKEVPYHYSHYHKDYSRVMPKKSNGHYVIGANGSMAVNHISCKAGQARLRKPKTYDEAKKYYGSAINDAVKSGVASIENSLFSRGIAYSYSSSDESKSNKARSASVATSASSSSRSNVSGANHSKAPKDNSPYEAKNAKKYSKYIKKSPLSNEYIVNDSENLVSKHFKHENDAMRYVNENM